MCIIISCSDHLDDDAIFAFNRSIPSGTWKVTHYEERGKIETDDFRGFSIEIKSDGSLDVLHSSGNTFQGTWRTFFDDGNQKLEFNLTDIDPLDELNDDWDIDKISSNVIELSDISGGDGHTSFLSLSRI